MVPVPKAVVTLKASVPLATVVGPVRELAASSTIVPVPPVGELVGVRRKPVNKSNGARSRIDIDLTAPGADRHGPQRPKASGAV